MGAPNKFAELAFLVGEMRDAQKAYFSTRSREALVAAKLAEKSVDLVVARFRAECEGRGSTALVDQALAHGGGVVKSEAFGAYRGQASKSGGGA